MMCCYTALQLLGVSTLFCISLAYPTRADLNINDKLFSDLLAELMSQQASTCSQANLSPGCCTRSCFVPGGRCFCDMACLGWDDCCSDVPQMLSCSATTPAMTMPPTTTPTAVSTPPSCINDNRPEDSGCCTNGSTACSVSGGSSADCFCDITCHAEGNCCHDIQQLNCLPTNCAEAGKLGCVVDITAGELCNVTIPGGKCYCDANCVTDCCTDAPAISPDDSLRISQRMRMKELAQEMSAYRSRGGWSNMQRDSLWRKYQAGILARIQKERPQEWSYNYYG